MSVGSNERKKNRLSTEDWLKLGLDVLVGEGEGALTIDKLCKRLGVTKGSFYAHFKDRTTFEHELVNSWVESFTTQWMIEVGKLKDASPEDRLLALVNMSHTLGRRNNDITFRVWAMHNPTVAKAVRKSDRQRFKYVKEIFHDIGFRGAELDMRTRVFWPSIPYSTQ